VKARISPASQLVAFAVTVTLVLTVLAGLRRPSGAVPSGGQAESPAPGAPALASGPLPSPAATVTGYTVGPSPAPQNPSPAPAFPTPEPVAPARAASAAPPPASGPGPTHDPVASPAASRAGIPEGELALGTLLSLLRVAEEQRSGYDRALFIHWIDADDDGCDTRREVLITEAIDQPAVSGSCSLSGGRWYSLYDGVETTDPSTLDIDHVVALAEAWDSGAFGWSTDRRTRYANDLDVTWALIAVSASSNRQKSDQDPSSWLPPLASVECEYLAMWIAVKARWDLAVDVTEKAVLEREIGACPQTMSVPVAP